MVKVSGACFSLEASGSLAGAITYQKCLKTRSVRKIPIPKPTRTTDQAEVRDTVSKAVTYWHNLLSSQQILWADWTDGNGNTGYQAFMSQWVKRSLAGLPQYELPPNFGYCIVGEHLVGELTVGGVWQDP